MTERQVRDYKKIEMPVVTFGKHNNKRSSSPGVFGYPAALTTDPTTTLAIFTIVILEMTVYKSSTKHLNFYFNSLIK